MVFLIKSIEIGSDLVRRGLQMRWSILWDHKRDGWLIHVMHMANQDPKDNTVGLELLL